MRRMSITEALVELKTLDSRIQKAINKNWCGIINTKDRNAREVIDEVERMKADYASVTDLMVNRAVIKSAIVKSNAVTEVVIGGFQMTVAEAIERKSSIVYEKRLLMAMKNQYANCTHEIKSENKKVDVRLDSILEKLVGSDKTKVSDEQKAIADAYRQNNEVELLDPLDINKKIENLDKKISEFEANVDVALSVSNATTFIEIE